MCKLFCLFLLGIVHGTISQLASVSLTNVKVDIQGQVIQAPMQNESPDVNDIYPIVRTPLGQLVGQAFKSRSGKWYYAFEGIPFASPPRRFELLPLPGLEHVTREHRDQSVPSGTVQGSLGVKIVYFPHYDRCQDEGKLAVIFNVHGGAYSYGAGSGFGTKFFLDECVIFVSPNYRLGALGFLTTNDGLIPGNLGLKDLVQALKWTKNYIGYFRGDPDHVTLMGTSAGASAVGHLVTSPMAKGLFHGAIAHSGAVLNPWSVLKNPNFYAINLADQLNCPKDSTANFKKCVLSKNLSDIISAQAKTQIPFAPVVEPQSEEFPFQTESPARRLKSGDFNKVPFLTGFVQDEVIKNDEDLIATLNKHWLEAAPIYFFYDQIGLSQQEKNEISIKIRKFYFGDKLVNENTRQNLTNLYSDRYFVQGIFETVELYSKHAPTFSFVMTYKGGDSGAWGAGYRIPAITHGDDNQFFFNYIDLPINSEQEQFSKNLVSSWINFAKTGMPNTPGKSSKNWLAVTKQSRANALWYRLDVPCNYYANYLDDRRQFWEKLGLYEREF